MDSSLIPVNEDEGVWDELNYEQTREIQQHLSQNQSSNILQETAASIKSVARRAALNFTFKPVTDDSSNLAEFGLNDEPLLGYDQQQRYEEFPQVTQNTGEKHFVFLQQFRFPQSQRDTWAAVSNPDLFFKSLYLYYYNRGLTPIIGSGVAELVSLFVTLWLSLFLFAYVDWLELTKCTDEESCESNLHHYMNSNPFSRPSLWNFIVIVYCVLFAFYSIFAVWSFWETLQDAFRAKHFFEDRLGISVERLEGGGVDWDRDVVSKLVDLQNRGDCRIIIHGEGNLDSLVIAQRIMRKENFMIAFFNRGIINLKIPFLTQKTLFCKSLEWSIYFCVLNYMFNYKYQVRPAFYLDPSALRRRFMLCGVCHAIFLPFLAFFMTLHFSMQNAYEWNSTKEYLGPKQWSLVAKWTFREFNELPHFFERRLDPSYEATEEYLKLFRQSELLTTVGRILAFIGSSFGSVLLLFATINDAILLHVKLGHFNLIWYAGILGIIYSAGKAMLPNPEIHSRYIRNLFEEMNQCLSSIAAHTHHYPDSWKGKGYDIKTRKLVTSMFNNKANIFANELLSLILAPLILCYYLPRYAEQICEFVMMVKAEVPGAGDICGYATFDFDNFNDENWEGKRIKEPKGNIPVSTPKINNAGVATTILPKPKTYHGKMEKSFFGFKGNHPSWTSTESGQTLFDRVQAFKEGRSKALAMEQKQHLEAAARQLETLSRLQQRKEIHSQIPPQIQESYIRVKSPRQPDVDNGGDSTGSLPKNTLFSSQDQLSPLTMMELHHSHNPQHNPFDATALVMSAELRRIVRYPNNNITTNASDQSILSHSSRHLPFQSLEECTSDERQRQIEQAQYLWLQKYHAHIAEQRRNVEIADRFHSTHNASIHRDRIGSINESPQNTMPS